MEERNFMKLPFLFSLPFSLETRILIKTNDYEADGMDSAKVTLQKDAAGQWKIAFLAYA